MSNSVSSRVGDRILRPAAVMSMLSVSRTTLWRLARQENFPRKIRLGQASMGWLESELEIWLQSRKEGSL